MSGYRTVQALLVGLAVLLVALQYGTLTKFGVFHPATSLVGVDRFIAAATRQIDFGFIDGALAVAVVLIGAALVALEVRGRWVGCFLSRALRSDGSALALLAVSALVGVRYYFAPGQLHWSGDAAQHIVYAHIAAQELARGEIPIWTFALGCGSPFLQNYGFLFFYLTGFVALFTPDVEGALKLCLACCHVGSGLGMYLFVRRLCHSRRAGFFAGWAYVLSMWHLQQVLIMGRLPLALFYALLPLGFYALELLADPRYRARATAGGALALAGLFFTHPGYGAYAGLFLGLYVMARLWSWRGRGDIGALVGYCAVLLAGGGLLSGYITIGMWVERVYTNMHDFAFGMRDAEVARSVADPTWHHVALWSNYRFWLWPPGGEFHWYGGYLGITALLLALVGVAAPRLLRRATYLPVALCLLAALWLVFAYRLPPVSHWQFFQNMNAARYLLFVCFFLAAVAGVGVHALLVLTRRRIFAGLLFALAVDLGATTFQHPYMGSGRDPTPWPADFFADARAEAAVYQARGELPPYRLFWPARGSHYLNTASVQHLSQVPSPHAFHPSELRALGAFTGPFLDAAQEALHDLDAPAAFHRLPRAAALKSGLFLVNVRDVVIHSKARRTGYIMSFASHGPLVVSSRLEPYDERGAAGSPNAALWIAEQMGVDPNRARSERILARGLARVIDLGGEPRVEVLAHRVWPARVEVLARVSAPCFARLAYVHSPFLEVLVDGEPTSPLETAGRFMALPLEAGERRIEIRARLSPLRRALLWVALGLVLLGGWAGYREWAGRAPLPGMGPVRTL